MDYIYKVEVSCFKKDGWYEANVWCRLKKDATAPWQICAIFDEDTAQEVFDKAYRYVEKWL